MSEEWYYFQNGSQVGPVSESVVREMLQSGRLRWDDLVWHDGLPDWLAAEQVPDLASARALTPPVAASAPPLFTAPAAAVTTAPPTFQPPVAAIPVQTLSTLRSFSPSTPAAPMFGSVSEGTVAILAKTRPWVRLLAILAMIGCVLMVLFGLAGLVMGIVTGGGGLTGAGIGAAALLAYLVAAAFILPMGLFLNRYAKGIRALQLSGQAEDLERALLAQKSYWKYLGVLTLVGIVLSILATVAMLILGLSGYLTSSY
ncbi:MAG: DUF4339 domain-containing protein [Acidobacteria bacterium]|nr:MAG: DUF4339 domain-containing protein [Acidobacteriota bacterium]